jgi:hypothetical protein
MQDGFPAKHGQVHHRGNENTAGVASRCQMASVHIVGKPVRHVLQRDRDARRLMMFEHRKVNELVYLARDDLRHIRAPEVRIIGVLAGLDQRHFHKVVRIVTGHVELDFIVFF